MHFVASEHLAVARHIVRTDFSEQVETLCSFLLCNGPSSLKDIVDSTGLPLPIVRNGLLALMQQNIVTCPVTPEIDTSAAAKAKRAAGHLPPIVYEASLDEVFGRLWFPRIVMVVRERFGEDAGLLLQELLTHGRMGHEDMVSKAAQSWASSAQLSPTSAEAVEKRRTLAVVAKKLQEARYIVMVEPLPPRPTAADASAAAPALAPAAAPSRLAKTGAPAAASSSGGGGGRGGKRGAAAPAAAEPKAPAAKRRKGAAAEKAAAEAEKAAAERAAERAAAEAAAAAPPPLLPMDQALWRCALERYRRDLRNATIQRFVGDKRRRPVAAGATGRPPQRRSSPLRVPVWARRGARRPGCAPCATDLPAASPAPRPPPLPVRRAGWTRRPRSWCGW